MNNARYKLFSMLHENGSYLAFLAYHVEHSSLAMRHADKGQTNAARYHGRKAREYLQQFFDAKPQGN